MGITKSLLWVSQSLSNSHLSNLFSDAPSENVEVSRIIEVEPEIIIVDAGYEDTDTQS